MRSSESTRNPRPSAPIRCRVLVVGDDDPKRCTGRRLLRLGLTSLYRSAPDAVPPPVVLDPYASEPLSAQDRDAATRGGLLAVDCSWNRLSERSAFGERVRVRHGIVRRLPLLLAANPQHYGRLAELNTAEALAAALCLLGRSEEAHALLEPFPGGWAFFEINAERLDHYARARTGEAVRGGPKSLRSCARTASPVRARA